MTNIPQDQQARLSRFILFLTQHPRSVLLVAVALCALAAASTSTLQPVASIDAMIARDKPAAQALAHLTQDFAAADELIILASIPEHFNSGDDNYHDTDDLVSFARRLSEVVTASSELSSMCEQVRWKPSPDIRTFVENIIMPNALLYLSDETISLLAERLTPEAMQQQMQKTAEMLAVPGGAGTVLLRTAIKDPLGLRDFLVAAMPRPIMAGRPESPGSEQGFFSSDGKHLLIRLRGKSPVSDLTFSGTFTHAIRDAADSVNEDNLDIAFTGAYAIAATAHQSIRGDMIRSIVLSILFLQILYLVVYRNIWMLPAALAPVAIGILFSFGMFSILGMNLSPMTAVIGAILAGLGIDYCIHIISHYQASRAPNAARTSTIVQTITELTPALTATCVTSVVGFVAISQSSVPALREFGILGAMGLIACLLLSVLLLPAILTLSPTPCATQNTATNQHKHSITKRLLDHAMNHRRFFLTFSGMASVAAISISCFAYDARDLFENDLTIMHPRPNEAMATQRQIEKFFPGAADPLLIYLEAPTPHDLVLLSHEVEKRLHDLASQNENVLGVFGLASLLPNPNIYHQKLEMIEAHNVDKIIRQFDAILHDSPFNPDAFEDYRLFLRKLFSPEQVRLQHVTKYAGITDFILPKKKHDHKELPTQAVSTVFTPKALGERSTRNETIQAVRSAIADLKGATLTGITVIGFDTENTIRSELGRLFGIAASVVIAWLMLQFRSVKAVILALLPATFGMIVLLTSIQVFEIKLNTFNLIALPLLVGIGVDDGIFLTMVSRHAKKLRQSRGDMVDALSTSCHAIGMTSLTTMLTFGTLAFTSTPAIQSLGLLLSIGVVASWVGAMWILTPLLAGAKGHEQPSKPN